jgi:hypothetical protein
VRSPGRASFVGRVRELALLDHEIARAASGRGCIGIVRGEPGVGKTWLVQEALARREAAGALPVRRARCSDAIGVPAWWPWRQLFDDTFRLAESPAAEAAAPLSDPFERLHRAAGEIFETCGSSGGILVIEDLQWADAGSIQLLDVLAQSIEEHPLAVLVTLRNALAPGEVADGIDALLRHRSVEPIPLQGWSPGEIRTYLEVSGIERPAGEAIETWHRVTGGNPYFVDELVRARAVLDEGASPPEGVQRLIERRLAGCDASTRLLVELAAVIGRDFPLALVRRLANSVLGDVTIDAAAVDRALAAHLLEPAESPDHFRFVHALVSDALLRGMSAARRAALHGQLGELLAEEPAYRAAGLAEVARHLATAAATLPAFAERALHFSRWAGCEASLRHSHDLAAHHYRAALDALAVRAGASDAAALARAELLVPLGYSLALASPQDADAALDEAEALAEARLAGEHGARSARILALAVVIRAHERCPATAEACRREVARADAALAGLGDADTTLRAQLLAAFAPLLAFEPDRERPLALAREALAVARATGDPLAQGRALVALHWSLLDESSADERLAVASEVLGQATRAGHEGLAATARYWRALDLLEGGHVAEAEAELAEIDEIAQRLGEPRRRHQALTLRAGLAMHRGRLDQAEALADEALALGLEAAIPESLVFHEGLMTRIAFERDDPARISNRETLRSALRSQPLFQVSNPLILRWQGREQSAATDMGLLKTRGFDAIPHGPDRLVTLYTLGWASFYLQDREAASALYDLLEPHAERIVVFHLGAFTGSVPRLMANLAALLGRTGTAQRHLRVAFREVERSDARCEWAHLHLERARLRMAQGQRADADPVVDDLRRALALAREVGSRRIENQIRTSHPELVADGDTAGAAERTGWFQRRGKVWSIGLGAPPHEVADGRGLHFIAALLARPGEEILASTLVADVTGDLEVPLERARLRVTQRVRSTLARLRALDPALAAHLANALRTGNYCAYLPRADDRIAWRL